jgi:hypothetical protein
MNREHDALLTNMLTKASAICEANDARFDIGTTMYAHIKTLMGELQRKHGEAQTPTRNRPSKNTGSKHGTDYWRDIV